MEKATMELNTEIYSIKCDAEMWKRKADAAAKESEWLKEQLKTLEVGEVVDCTVAIKKKHWIHFQLDKTQALRKVEELSRQNGGLEQFRAAVESYVKKTKDNMSEVQR